MESSTSTPSRRSYDIPKPETGLAEWTSKIKALQREVDADEEAEQKRLEEEISAARQARLRRSRGAGGRGDSMVMSSNRELLQDSGRSNDDSLSDIPKSVAQRANDQDTALRKLIARNDVYIPDKILPSTSPRAPATEPKSLASFIGGRASGPRLNRHAPQQDAHDPTQFIQPNLSAPHPVFGRGGIAMPGMAPKRGTKSTSSLTGSELSERYQPSSIKNTISPIPVIVAPESPKDESFDARRRSFTTKTSPTPALKDAPNFESHSNVGARTRIESSQDEYATGFRVNPPSESSPPPVISSAPKPLPSYLGTNYTSKSVFPSSAPLHSEPLTSNSAQTPLGRLMETNNVYNPDKLDGRKTISERAQSVSLAGFIGGKAGGPRLNKHAPQPDAHDPTQFIQPDTNAPHPIFGRGGIAMPGLASHKGPESHSTTDNKERYRPSPSGKTIWPPVKTPYAEKFQDDRPVSPEKAGSRERTLSTPGFRSNIGASIAQSPDSWSSTNIPSYDMGRRSPSKGIRPTTPSRDRTISTSSAAPIVTTPTLARPIQPEPKMTSISPMISTTVPSPAFQKPAASKDLTPSISRLQGRGFVQSMVKVSSQLDTAPPTSPSVDKPRPVSATGRKSSVLDRWQPHAQQSSPSTKSYTPIRRSATQEPTTPTGARSSLPITDGSRSSHTLKSVASLPSLAKSTSTPSTTEVTEEPTTVAEPYQRSRTPGLGSATTMVLIKPSKSATDLTQLTHVDELGVRRDAITATSSKKPLIHPTKERARKPKKLVDSAPQGPTMRSAVKPFASGETAKATPDVSLISRNLAQMGLPVTSPREDSIPESITPGDGTSINHGHEELLGSPTTQSLTFYDEPALELPDNINEPVVKSRSQPTSPVVLSFNKQGRIPSTGVRPTVMEVAKVLIDQEKRAPLNAVTDSLVSPQTKVDKPQTLPIHTEKRRSTYGKYSSFVLPPLKEEATPSQTPIGTLNPRTLDVTAVTLDKTSIASKLPHNTQDKSEEAKFNDILLVSYDSELSTVELAVLKSEAGPQSPASDTQTISVDLLALVGTTASPVVGAFNIFYEPEILVIVHRTKSKSSGLASTSVWCWLGRRCILGNREEKKLHDLAKHYGTSARIVYHLAEPPELIQSLGGNLIIRQGSRTHWSPENTTMHLVRSIRGVIIIDELDLTIRNLCSAFSYCLTILGSVYVWHGRGSTMEEQIAAINYAKSLINGTSLPIELLEGESDDDDMFWMILGEEDFARADYWKWRKTAVGDINPSIWKAEPNSEKYKIIPVNFISLEKDLQQSVYIINCVWEFFVLVGKEAQSNRRAIRFALDIAARMSRELSSSRPYNPTVHALVLPSQIPLDLQLGIRDIDEAWLNNGEIPDHMNLLSYSDATSHLTTHSWGKLHLEDQDMLLLGVGLTEVS